MSERVRVMLSEEEVDKRIKEIGDQISKDYEGKQVHLVCVLKGGSFSGFNSKHPHRGLQLPVIPVPGDPWYQAYMGAQIYAYRQYPCTQNKK